MQLMSIGKAEQFDLAVVFCDEIVTRFLRMWPSASKPCVSSEVKQTVLRISTLSHLSNVNLSFIEVCNLNCVM